MTHYFMGVMSNIPEWEMRVGISTFWTDAAIWGKRKNGSLHTLLILLPC